MKARIHGVLTPWNPGFSAFAEAQDALDALENLFQTPDEKEQ